MNAQAMTRRAAAHDYTQAGIYHITMHVADGLGQPLSHLVGSEIAPADSPDEPRTELTAIGQMMEQELLQECGPHQATGEVLAAIESRLLLTNGIITCDSYGDRALLSRRLLLVTPWQYQYRGKSEQVTVPFCKAMNCVAQALCRTKDDWWKTTN